MLSVKRMWIFAGVTLTVRLSTTVIFGHLAHDLGGYWYSAVCMLHVNLGYRKENNIIDNIQVTIVNSYC